jgi:ribosome-binding protein aMBF1 (putative translation factor)
MLTRGQSSQRTNKPVWVEESILGVCPDCGKYVPRGDSHYPCKSFLKRMYH